MFQDEDLIEGCKNGDKRIQRRLYEQYSSALMSVACRYSRTEEDARDIVQESFIKIFKKIGTFRNESSLKHWMRRIVVNTAINFQRSKLYLYPMMDVNDMYDLKEEAMALNDYSFQELLNLLQRLPDGCRVIFNLYAIEGYKHKEIAEMTGVTEGTSKSQFSRARKLLKAMIEESEIERYCYAKERG
ncbi:RNA polymerase sigma factor [Flammeovirga kamogawensis]|uniref:RNA polymerase sigma factor n=1 Tax=Flammeovirga kamogawensis TaxID=373891 RepID=A0ABX8GRJ4_9BACT|nr:RNA polymerase sigma factor [Flammeovirga kamogawensis]MBB6463832.1 RNA polymerase sigma-70 factor (ECF subfamily) [Flammeovirga kamogawensis]QWG06151.1 RNA polymerase sigma factor [Flammeovirga kamogawensis]TRX67982.1 RNA polymerase sigma factor [Flammeovirga kamogawensis]